MRGLAGGFSWTFALTFVCAGLVMGPQTLSAHTGHAHPCPDYPRHEADGSFDANRVIEKRVPVARRMARRHDCTVRVIKRDGKRLSVTDDRRFNRINVVVRNDFIIRMKGVY